MTTEVMVDLETLGTGPRAPILSIGAVKFNPHSDWVGPSFHVGVDISTGLFDREVDGGTLMWWLAEDRAAARKAWLDLEKHDLVTALDGFVEWFGGESLPVWGNGATFDNVILTTAFDTIGSVPPWKFWHDRCYRTMKNLVDIPMTRFGTHHSAVDDAISQAKHLQEIYTHFGLQQEAV